MTVWFCPGHHAASKSNTSCFILRLPSSCTSLSPVINPHPLDLTIFPSLETTPRWLMARAPCSRSCVPFVLRGTAAYQQAHKAALLSRTCRCRNGSLALKFKNSCRMSNRGACLHEQVDDKTRAEHWATEKSAESSRNVWSFVLKASDY